MAEGADFLFIFGDTPWVDEQAHGLRERARTLSSWNGAWQARLFIRPGPGIHRSGFYADQDILVFWWGDWRNQAELRALLREPSTDPGQIFARGWQRYGVDFLGHVMGVVAGIVYAASSPGPVLFRDTIGLNPVLWDASSPRGLMTSSDPDWLLEARPSDPRPDLDELRSFLRSIDDEGEGDFLIGLRRLRPHEWMRWCPGKIEKGRYWSPRTAYDLRSRPHAEEVHELLRKILASSTLPEPRAVAMSGGVDSSLACALEIERGQGQPVPVASMIAPGLPGTNEEAMIAVASKALGVRPHTFSIEDRWPMARPEDHLGPLAWGPQSAGENSYYLPFWRMIRERLGAPTVITGVGADQLFSTPSLYYYRRLLSVRPLVGARQVAKERGFKELLWHSAVVTLDGLHVGPRQRAAARKIWASVLGTNREVFPWLTEDWIEGTAPSIEQRVSFSGSDYRDNGAWRLEELRRREWEWACRSIATAARATSLAQFLPFLDRRLWDYGLPIPLEASRTGRRDKIILRSIAGRYLPSGFAFEPKHGGFDAVIERGLGIEAVSTIRDLFAGSCLARVGLIDDLRFLDAHAAYSREAAKGSSDFLGSFPLWRTIAAELWLQRLLDGRE